MRVDSIGKLFITVYTNGDLPTNPMSLRECLVCGEFFTRDESREHTDNPAHAIHTAAFAGAGLYR
jgi:hypothetical protein